MNKCILCTFLKMVWNGLWDNTCPSVDKKKEEKKAPFLKLLKELVFGVIFSAFALVCILSAGYLLLYFVAWLLGISISDLFAYLILFVAFPIGLIGGIVMAIKSAKIRIACIKAYWRKAKEACE